ncbi:hypothetical protein M5K25_018785 [Dendrobium thyrsiflorum]|uniref:Glycosyl hydrolase family 13 catalytic domain-containing protein n=1 Tax=Dendrobium thyrsiflorum TaxID=117978 RepID=A0ABD0UDH3_DENTH
MATSCSPYSSPTSVANAEARKNRMLLPVSLGVCRKGNIPLTRPVYAERRCRSCRKFFCDASNDSLQIRTSEMFTGVASSSKDEAQPVLEMTYDFEKQNKGYSFLFRTEFDGLVKVFVGAIKMKYTVCIEVQSLPQSMISHNLILLWGMFRSDSLLFHGPDSHSSVLPTTKFKPEASQHPMKTPFVRDSCWHILGLDFDQSDVPFYLSFFLQPDGTGQEPTIRTHRKTNFCVPVGLGPGFPMPLGVSSSNDALANFSLFSRNAKSVVLCFYKGKTSEPSLEIDLDPYVNHTGDIWHVSIDNITNYIGYGYRCKGDISWDGGSSSNAHHVLLDPYAKMIGNLSSAQGESAFMVKCLGFLQKEPNFDWSGDTHPQIPMEKLIIYRLNVRQFTKSESSELAINVAGTFAGVVKKVQHLINLGINAVLLEPVFSFDEKRGPYFPYHFFSPMSIYGGMDESISSVYSMKEMVKILHSHGIEVLLEVVFTHTCEVGDSDSQIISLLGIDNPSYYIVDGNVHLENCSALKCNDPIVQQMILDSLHHWVTEFHVDGFCFINSSSLLQGSNGDHLPRPPLVEDIAFDPLLSETKIISDCWSPIDMSYKDAIFPHWQRWAEMNSKYFLDVRNFLRGQGLLSHLATRLCGSGDIFTASRGPAYSFNYITKNAGLTLVDLVSFSGADLASELSWNCGVEGPTEKNSVLEIRLRQVRNFLFILFISLGVPVINMGDECGYSTGGSPFYDNRVPIDWKSLRTGFSIQIIKFVAFLASLRNRRSDIFQRKIFYKAENITWHGSNLSPPKWEDPSCKFLAMKLKAEKDVKSGNSYNGDLFITINASDIPELVTLPESSAGYIWFRLVDTSLPYPYFFSSDSNPNSQKNAGLSSYELKPHTCALFEAKVLDI